MNTSTMLAMWRADTAGGPVPESTIEMHRPLRDGSGASVIVCPGGGYSVHADHEAAPVAAWLAEHGVTAFVLRYRLAPHRHPAMLHDATRAIRFVRNSAPSLGLDPGRVGILGFSAGGHLAGTASTQFDAGLPDAIDEVERESSRPDLAVLVYPVTVLDLPFGHVGSAAALLGSSADPALLREMSVSNWVSASTPPMFLVHSADDEGVPVENSLLLAAALSEHHVPFELHVFPHGGHGYGLALRNERLSAWTRLCIEWLAMNGFVDSYR